MGLLALLLGCLIIGVIFQVIVQQLALSLSIVLTFSSLGAWERQKGGEGESLSSVRSTRLVQKPIENIAFMVIIKDKQYSLGFQSFEIKLINLTSLWNMGFQF